MNAMIGAGLLLLATASASAEDWWNSAWQYRQRVSLNASEIAEDLVDFPITLPLGDAEFGRTRAKPDGSDFRVIAADGTEIPYELVRWDADGV